jgi:hypothetical protein
VKDRGGLIPIEAPTEAPLPPMANINLSLEQKHTTRELVKDMHLPKEGGKFDLKVGASVSASVVLAAVPVEIGNKVPQIKSHRLFVTGERIVLGQSQWPAHCGSDRLSLSALLF